MPLPEDKHKPASQVPKERSAENILFSQLTKGKEEERAAATSPTQAPVKSQTQNEEPRIDVTDEPLVAEPAASPEIGSENKEPITDRNHESGRSHTKARTVLDNLLFNNNSTGAETRPTSPPKGEWESGAAEALEHGDKFLAWLEASGDPSVTRMHVHQLRALLHNLRARRHAVPSADHTAHRK